MPGISLTKPEAWQLAEKALRVKQKVQELACRGRGNSCDDALAVVDLLVALYFGVMRVDPARPRFEGRDRLVLSHPRAWPALLCTLAERGFFPLSRLEPLAVLPYGKDARPWAPLPSEQLLPGVEYPQGPLGHGLSTGLGMVLAARVNGLQPRVYVLLGQEELREGQLWEAALAAAHLRATSLTAIVALSLPLPQGVVHGQRLASFGWRVFAAEGEDQASLLAALAQCGLADAPSVLLWSSARGS